MAFDGIVTKAITSELQNLSGARIDKVFQPNKNNIILGFYLNGTNYSLNICIDSQNCRLNLTKHLKQNPTVAPSFCMLLRKHLIGLKIKNFITFGLERIIIIEFEGFDEVDDLINKKMVIELMGKHSNIILVDDNNVIIDSMRHIYPNSEIYRTITSHTKYIFPTTNKMDFFEIKNFEEFSSYFNDCNECDLPKLISSKFNGISQSFIEAIMANAKKINLNDIYAYINEILDSIGNNDLQFEYYKNDYFLTKFKINNENNFSHFNLNFFIDEFYYKKETSEQFKSYRDSLLKMILSTLKKYRTRLANIDKKLEECNNMDKYKLYGELITANLYRLPNYNVKEVELENYYDNNKLLKIPLNDRYTPSINAKRFFKKYNKLKNTLIVVNEQKKETMLELNYIESIAYELQNTNTIDDVIEIYEEISENIIFKDNNHQSKSSYKLKKSKLTRNKTASFNPIKYKIGNFTLFVGRNNVENDYLTLKFAKKSDIWFHTKDIHGSHAILKLEDSKTRPDYNILIKCAEITAYHSKARNSSNVPVDFCEVFNAIPFMTVFALAINKAAGTPLPDTSAITKARCFSTI